MNDSFAAKQPTTPKDFVCLIAVGAPIVLLGCVVVWAAVAWQIESGQLRQRLESLGGSDTVSILTAYDQKTSRATTSKVNHIISAAHAISYEIDTVSDHGEPFHPWIDFPPPEFFEAYARQGNPVLEQWQALQANLPTTWQGGHFTNQNWNMREFMSSNGLRRLVQCDCIDAIHQNEMDRAIAAFKSFSFIESSCREHVGRRTLYARGQWIDAMSAIVTASLQRDVWSEDQLKELEDVFAQPDQIRQYVKELGGHSQAIQRQIANRSRDPFHFYDSRLEQMVTIGPSENMALLSAIASSSVGQLNNANIPGNDRPPVNAMDQVLQFPLINIDGNHGAHLYSLRLLSSQMIKMEAVRMAIAVKRFKKRLGRYPANLDELTKIGTVPSRSRVLRYSILDNLASISYHGGVMNAETSGEIEIP